MNIEHHLNLLERWAKPDEHTFYTVHLPRPDESAEVREQRERELAEAEAQGERLYRIRIPSPRDEPCD